MYILEKKIATHSSVLAWRIPGTGESRELPSMGSHRVSQTRLKRLSSSSSSSGSVEEGMANHSSILVWRIPWQATVRGIAKSQTRLID